MCEGSGENRRKTGSCQMWLTFPVTMPFIEKVFLNFVKPRFPSVLRYNETVRGWIND